MPLLCIIGLVPFSIVMTKLGRKKGTVPQKETEELVKAYAKQSGMPYGKALDEMVNKAIWYDVDKANEKAKRAEEEQKGGE